MVAYGIASSLSQDIDDFYASSEEADAALAEILNDEPELEGALWVESVEFELSTNLARARSRQVRSARK